MSFGRDEEELRASERTSSRRSRGSGAIGKAMHEGRKAFVSRIVCD